VVAPIDVLLAGDLPGAETCQFWPRFVESCRRFLVDAVLAGCRALVVEVGGRGWPEGGNKSFFRPFSMPRAPWCSFISDLQIVMTISTDGG